MTLAAGIDLLALLLVRRGKVLQQNARQEIDSVRHITDTEEISKRLILAWDCVKQIQDKVRGGCVRSFVSRMNDVVCITSFPVD